MEFHRFLRRAITCTDDELVLWIFNLEQQEIFEGRQSITDIDALDRWREIRKCLVVLRVELLERSHENDRRVSG